MPYKARQKLKCGDKIYKVGEVVPDAENSKNLFDLLRTNYLYYADEEPQVKKPEQVEPEQVEPEKLKEKKSPAKTKEG
jgi:hypothetical protein